MPKPPCRLYTMKASYNSPKAANLFLHTFRCTIPIIHKVYRLNSAYVFLIFSCTNHMPVNNPFILLLNSMERHMRHSAIVVQPQAGAPTAVKYYRFYIFHFHIFIPYILCNYLTMIFAFGTLLYVRTFFTILRTTLVFSITVTICNWAFSWSLFILHFYEKYNTKN